MKKIILFLYVVFFVFGCSVESFENSQKKINTETIIGKWKIDKIQKYRGGMTSEDEAKTFIGNLITISKEKFNFLDNIVEKPKYKIIKILNKANEGVVGNKSLSSFYGYKTERKYIYQLVIYENDEIYMECEIDEDCLLFFYDGWILFANKETDKV